MIVFGILFLLIVIISALLAFGSMKDFRYGVFLIRKPQALTPRLLLYLHQTAKKSGLFFSLERLFKGFESALVIYGPKKVMIGLTSLGLLELEDYCLGEIEALVFEISFKSSSRPLEKSLFLDFPKLEGQEQIWFQFLLQAQKEKNPTFKGKIRVAVLSLEAERLKKLSEVLIKTLKVNLSYENMEVYRKRSWIGKTHSKFTVDEIVKAWKLPIT